ncbi:MAG TPA: hypothetical protein VMF56_07920 [Acidobacteriaceae bacterium]|nr:hypothetical protein [Acidobacteriaceae bacterium]
MKSVTHVTFPMSVVGNTPIVTLTFNRPGGDIRTARFIFDSGGGAIIFDQGLANDLGLLPEGPIIASQGERYRRVHVPAAFAGGMPIDFGASHAFVHLGTNSFTNRVAVEGMLPGKAFEHYQVVLDYPRQLFSIGEPRSLQHRGTKLACPYIASSGHPMIEVGLDRAKYEFLLDTGSNISLARVGMLKKWSKEHPNWPTSIGAAGPANDGAASDADAFLLRIPALQLGAFRLTQIVAASRSDETYSPTSYETPAPIIGALGGNVLSRFRVEIDYPDHLLFLEPSGRKNADDFDTVGLVLSTNAAGQLVVRAVSSTASAVTRRNVQPGDIIVSISGFDKAPRTLMKAVEALSGAVGERKQLRILRHGKPMRVTVTVARIL